MDLNEAHWQGSSPVSLSVRPKTNTSIYRTRIGGLHYWDSCPPPQLTAGWYREAIARLTAYSFNSAVHSCLCSFHSHKCPVVVTLFWVWYLSVGVSYSGPVFQVAQWSVGVRLMSLTECLPLIHMAEAVIAQNPNWHTHTIAQCYTIARVILVSRECRRH